MSAFRKPIHSVLPGLGRGGGGIFPGSALALDFANGRYQRGGAGFVTTPAAVAGWSFTRASAGYGETQGGVLLPFGVNVPRATDKGLLVEEAATNTLRWSQAIDNVVFTKVNHTVVANATGAPDGTTTADSLTRSSAVAGCFTSHTFAGTVGQTWLFSRIVKAKSAGGRYGLRIQSSYPDRCDAVFDLVAGTVIGTGATNYTGTTAGIRQLGSTGWYQIWVKSTVGGSTGTQTVEGPTDGGQVVGAWEGASAVLSDAYVWNGDLILNPTAVSSPILTTSSAVTRAADVASVSGIPAQGAAFSFAAEVDTGPTMNLSADRYIFGLGAVRPGAYFSTAGNYIGVITSVNSAFSGSAGVAGVKKLSGVFNQSDQRGAISGATVTPASRTWSDGAGDLTLGSLSGGGFFNSYIKNLRLYNAIHTDTQLIANAS